MNGTGSEAAYRHAAAYTVKAEELVIQLLDQVVRDLRRAVQATHNGDPAGRAAALRHGFQVLGQLELLLDHDHGGELVVWLSRFYAQLRSDIVKAQVANSAEKLELQITRVLDIRGAWRERISQQTSAPPVVALAPVDSPGTACAPGERSTWSA